MGRKGNSWLVLWIMFGALFWEIRAARNHTLDMLDAFLYTYALQAPGVHKLRTGTLYTLPSPANMSGVEASFIRLRTNRLWRDGTNFSSIEIPPRTTLPQPFTRRISIVYQNLGNWSSSYYSVSGYTLVAPVVAFLAYDAYTISSRTSQRPIDLVIKGHNDKQINVHFPTSTQPNSARIIKCVRFDVNGSYEVSNMSTSGTCGATGTGHFSLVIPEEENKNESKNGKFKGWIIGIIIAGGIVGLGILGFIGCVLSEWINVRKMERQAERSEGLNTIWIGESRMPKASGIRTQPILENTYLP